MNGYPVRAKHGEQVRLQLPDDLYAIYEADMKVADRNILPEDEQLRLNVLGKGAKQPFAVGT